MRSVLRASFVILGAILLSALVIRASDGVRVPGSGLFAGIGISQVSRCGQGMMFLDISGGGLCVDTYEASAGSGCPYRDPRSALETQINLGAPNCLPESVPNARPWTNVPVHQAEALCARAGKRLPTALEWYRAAIGTPDRTDGPCVLSRVDASRAEETGHGRCISSSGVQDMVGNVWEWVAESVEDGMLGNRRMPETGYVVEIAADGIASKTAAEPDPVFNGDYASFDASGVRGIFRGGFWGMTEKAGIYAVNASVPPTFTGDAIGFRCVRMVGG
jgi:formylglycine-generating enzyme required for sulfatase activity